MGKIVAVLEISDDFDQFFESEPLFDADSLDQCTNSSVEAMMTYLQVTSRADVSRVIDRLPVFPRAAREVVRQVANPDVGPREMEAVASLDPVLAGRLIQTANSAYYSPRQPIGTIFQAVSFIGTETARRVLLAAAIRGNFSSPQAHQLWNHSLDVAQIAELVAMHSSVKIDPSQAFLAGLIHDIGRLAFAIMPVAFQERFQRLTDGGCPPVEVEMCLSGRCHGEVGAETLAQWKFPLEIIEAVRWHHRPERSDAAAELAALSGRVYYRVAGGSSLLRPHEYRLRAWRAFRWGRWPRFARRTPGRSKACGSRLKLEAGYAGVLKTSQPAPGPEPETGWLPDLIYTGGAFRSGLAMFADAAAASRDFLRRRPISPEPSG